MAKTSIKSKPRTRALSVYLAPDEITKVKKAALKQRRKITSYIASVLVPQAERDLRGAA